MRRILWLPASLLAALAFGLALAALARNQAEEELPVLGEMPPFAFTDHLGEPIADTDLRGRTTLVGFLFTRCPTVCPVTTMKLRRITEETEDLGDRLRIVSFSVDPEHDTPDRLAAFAEQYRVNAERWRLVTGPAEKMRAHVEGALKIAMDVQGELADGGPNIIHGTHFVLVDEELQIRGYYDSYDPERLEALERDARALAR